MRPCRERCRRAALRLASSNVGCHATLPKGSCLTTISRFHCMVCGFFSWEDDLVSVRLPSNTVKAAIPFPGPRHSTAVAWAMRQCSVSHPRSVVSTAEQRQRRVFHWFAHAPGTHTTTVSLDRGGFLIWRHSSEAPTTVQSFGAAHAPSSRKLID